MKNGQAHVNLTLEVCNFLGFSQSCTYLIRGNSMFKRTIKRTIGITAATVIILSANQFSYTAKASTNELDAVSLVKLMVGKEYTVYEETPASGFDASGLMYYVFK